MNLALERAAIKKLDRHKPTPLGFRAHDGIMRRALLGGGGNRTSLLAADWDVAGTGKLRCLSPTPRTIEGAQPVDDWIVGAHKRPRAWVDMTMRCRRCEMCLKYRGWMWTQRAINEMAACDRTWFGTLTLSPEEHLRALQLARVREWAAGGDLEYEGTDYQFGARHSVISEWITKYLKRVRKAAGSGVRVMVVCEAHASGLPHYHLFVHEAAGSKTNERLLRLQWVHGFSMFKLVEKGLEGKAAWYVAKYLVKSTRARVRASVDYGSGGTSEQSHRAVAEAETRNALSKVPAGDVCDSSQDPNPCPAQEGEGRAVEREPFARSSQGGG